MKLPIKKAINSLYLIRFIHSDSRIKKSGIALLFMLLFGIVCHAQKPPLPLDAYGVWIRGDISYNSYFDGFKAVRANYEWSDIQPADSLHFNLSDLQKKLEDAYENDLYVYVSVLVGPDSPEWIYDMGVPKVYVNEDTKWPYYPYYLDPDYKRYFYTMIEEVADFIRSQPVHLADRVCFVYAAIGCTGDYGPYKGTPQNLDYLITDSKCSDLKMAAWEQFKAGFNDGKERKRIPIVINATALNPETHVSEWDWVNHNIDPEIGFGIKGSAYMRGHHLTGEKEFRDLWMQNLQNPQGMQIFSRGEMDQTWTWPLYQINLPLGFYWGMLSGLNTGLSVWDITESAIEYASTSAEVQDVFRFFNKHAPQIYPSIAKAAYVIFHEGLNSENTIKFPPELYGEATRDNESRYEAICQAYSDRGARMDDTYAATRGQVDQRHNQTGYNDAGWSIQEGNYEHWIEQINPEETSIALFRVRGKIDASSSKYDRFARSFEHASVKDTMYFKFHDEVFSLNEAKKLTCNITWLDKTANSSWEFWYDNGEETLAPAAAFTGAGDGQWKTETVVLTDAVMKHNGARGSDFALVNTDDMDDIFHGIEVDIERVGDDLDSVAIESPEEGDEFIIGDSVTVTAMGFDVQGIDRMRFSLDENKKFIDDLLSPYTQSFKDLNLGDHVLKVKMKDSIGYWVNAEPVSISIIPLSDTVFIQAPLNGDEKFMGDDVVLKAYGYDYQGIQNLKFRVDEGSFHTVAEKPFEYTFSGLSEGSHTFDVQMTDLSGNSLMSEGITLTIVNPPDSVSILTPADGDTIMIGVSVKVTTYCYDGDGIERIRFLLDNSDNWDNVLSPPYEYTYYGLSEGRHLIEVQMKDLNGERINAESVSITVIPVDSVSIISPRDGALIPLGEEIVVSASCHDNQGIDSVGFRVDQEAYNFVTQPPYEYTYSGLTTGTHTFKAQMIDNTGRSIFSEAISITLVLPDSVSITSPLNGDTISLGEDILVIASCHDNDGIESVGFSMDEDNYNTLYAPPYQYNFANLNEGTHSFHVQMTDLAGNSLLSEAIEIFVEDQTQNNTSFSNELAGKMIAIYPTLVNKALYCHSSKEIDEVHICNLLGKSMLIQKANIGEAIDVSSLDPGIYIVYFEYDRHLVIAGKIVKQ